MNFLKLSAFDGEDLEVISTHMQDAVLRVRDMKFLPGQKRFALVANRFDWEQAQRNKKGFQRHRTGLHFDRVNAARAQNIRQEAGDAVLELLSITFRETEEPSGAVILSFSDGATIELDVECIDCGLADLGPVWGTRSLPEHDIDEINAD